MMFMFNQLLKLIFIVFWGIFPLNNSPRQDTNIVTDSGQIAPSQIDSLQLDSLRVDSSTAVQDTSINKDAFKNGEVLSFDIRYGFIVAGTAKMKVFTKMYNDNRFVYQLQTTAKSARGFSWIYSVNDVVNSFVDYNKFYPIRFEKKLREGSYEADLYTDYFPEDSLAKVETIRYDDGKIRNKKEYEVTVPPYVQDILSSFYYIRRQKLEVGKEKLRYLVICSN